MTGSAKIARFIAAIVCSLAMFNMPGHCAAPKDALKYLQFTHQSSIRLQEHDGNPPRYSDAYKGLWIFDWKPPTVKLGRVGTLRPSFHYKQTQSDRLDKLASTSLDSRSDYYRVNLDVRELGHLNLNYSYERSDEFQRGSVWNSTTTHFTGFGLKIPDLPTLNFSNRRSTSTQETNQSWFQIQFKRNVGTFGQDYKYKYQNNTGTKGSNKSSFSQFNGYRQFKYDKFGTLQFVYDFKETNKYRDPGPTNEITTNNLLSLIYTNKMSGFPLDYQFRFTSSNNSLPTNNNSEEIKFIRLTYRAPAPTGKRLTVTFDKLMKERFELFGSRPHTAEEITNLQWGFQTNARTSGSLRYSQINNTNLKLKQSTKQVEKLNGDLKYRIPGNQGVLNGQVSHLTNMSQGNRSITDIFTVNNTFKLGKEATVMFSYTQNYDGNDFPRGDQTISTVHYKFQKDEISLDARWQQNMHRPNDVQKNVTHSFPLHFAYIPPASKSLRYDFLLHGNGTSDTMNFRPNNPQYLSKNDIELKVTYTF